MSPQAVIAEEVARRSYIMAISCGSRKKGYDGNKTLPPLEPGPASYESWRSSLYRRTQSLPSTLWP